MKSGIDYFPLDVALDSKMELIEAEFGLTGFGVVVKLLQYIYGGQGYYVEWTNEVALLFAKRIGLGGSAVSEIIAACIKRGMFDKEIFDKYSVLTSRGIQRRYFEAVSRRKEIEVDDSILLIKVTDFSKSVNIKRKNVNISAQNDDIFKQSKEEKRRVKESKVSSDKSLCNLPVAVQSLFNEICISFPKCTTLSDKRIRAINARLKTGRTLEDFKKCFSKAQASDFLKGANSKNWSATFDWLIADGNMPKVLDGNYDNKPKATKPPPTPSRDFTERKYSDEFYDGLFEKKENIE